MNPFALTQMKIGLMAQAVNVRFMSETYRQEDASGGFPAHLMKAEVDFATKCDAKRMALHWMHEATQRIANGAFTDIRGWRFLHHEDETSGILPEQIPQPDDRTSRDLCVQTALEVMPQLRKTLKSNRRDYNPDWMVIIGKLSFFGNVFTSTLRKGETGGIHEFSPEMNIGWSKHSLVPDTFTAGILFMLRSADSHDFSSFRALSAPENLKSFMGIIQN